jgi:hypothetical protein
MMLHSLVIVLEETMRTCGVRYQECCVVAHLLPLGRGWERANVMLWGDEVRILVAAWRRFQRGSSHVS